MILRKVFIFLIFFCFLSSLSWGKQQETFPFLGQVVNDKVNVRAGGNMNFEKLCQLKKGDEVIVIGKEYSWYKVQIPQGAAVYITKKYVQLTSPQIGQITAKDVNVRALPHINASVVGRVTIGDRIYILEELQDWYKIEPLDQTYGWMAEDMLVFKSQDISSYPVRYLSKALVELEQQKKDLEDKRNLPQEEKQERTMVLTLQGQIKEMISASQTDAVRFFISENDVPSYYVQAPLEIIKLFLNHRVVIEGKINTNLKEYSYPVVTVTKIQFVL
ncbi:MAG TPA: SH3 domain-containing protein [Candidatus Omnitrophota bacterium]|nr:SH3 domain-containing protein [Candidatus Omnitrophota bacterium]